MSSGMETISPHGVGTGMSQGESGMIGGWGGKALTRCPLSTSDRAHSTKSRMRALGFPTCRNQQPTDRWTDRHQNAAQASALPGDSEEL